MNAVNEVDNSLTVQDSKSALGKKKHILTVVVVVLLIVCGIIAVCFASKHKKDKPDMIQYKVSEVIYQLDDGTSEDENSGIMYRVADNGKSIYWFCPIYSETSAYGWIELNGISNLELNEQSFDDLFPETGINPETVSNIKQDNKDAVYAQTEGRVFYFLRQNNGDIYMFNLLKSEDGKDYIRNIQKLEETALADK